jgi:DNA-binding FadR family transcriptional regulator
MPIAIVETRRLYRQIAAQLSALIASGEFAVGQRLPSERELAAQLGVSRPSLREALIALELEGLVEVRVGAGIWVTAASGRDPATPVQQTWSEIHSGWISFARAFSFPKYSKLSGSVLPMESETPCITTG